MFINEKIALLTLGNKKNIMIKKQTKNSATLER